MADDDRLIYLVFTAQQKLRNYLKSSFVRGDITVTPVQTAILALLIEKNSRTMSELSTVLSIDNSTMTGLVDRLERAGFVRRRPGEGDRRISLIDITPAGDDEARRAILVLKRVNDEIKQGFTGADITAFKKVLRSFFTKFDTER